MNPESARIEHLKVIESVISRLGRNSFAIKSTAAAASAALVAFTASTGSSVAAIAGLALLPLWTLDARYLAQERGFRRLYDSVREGSPSGHGSSGYFSMEVPSPEKSTDKFPRVLSSPSLSLFYAPLLALVGVSSLISLL